MSLPDPPAPGLSPRRRAVYLLTAVALLVSVVVPVALFSDGGSDAETLGGTTAAAPGVVSSGKVSGPSLEGRLIEVETTRIVIVTTRPVDGQDLFELRVRPLDAAALNIDHLSIHAGQGLPTRIFYEQKGDVRYAVGQQDAEGGSALPFGP